jgi:hypothetical protein
VPQLEGGSDYRSRAFPVEFAVLDRDDVLVTKLPWAPSEMAQLTGVKGDAFWLIYNTDSITRTGRGIDQKQVKRIELRPVQREFRRRRSISSLGSEPACARSARRFLPRRAP